MLEDFMAPPFYKKDKASEFLPYEDLNMWRYFVVDVKGDGNCGYYSALFGLIDANCMLAEYIQGKGSGPYEMMVALHKDLCAEFCCIFCIFHLVLKR